MSQKTALGIIAAGIVGSGASILLLVFLLSAPPEKPRNTSRQELAQREDRQPEPRPPPSPERPAPVRPWVPPVEVEEKRPEFVAPITPPRITKPPRMIEPKPELPSPDEPPIPVPGEPLKQPIVPGYETRRVNGFVMFLSTHAIKEGKKENGRPFQTLVTEFDGLVKVLPPNALKTLRKVPVWIEWDNLDDRHPNTLAKYYGGGGAIWRLDPAEAIKADGVEVLSLKKLAEEKQQAVDGSRLVLLHELAHAAHYVFVPGGFSNPNVRFAYKQAMDRRLYNDVPTARGGKARRAYAATSAAEYFAELTCAYLDRCYYYPFTREELKSHDPTGYQLMEKFWGKPIPKIGKPKP